MLDVPRRHPMYNVPRRHPMYNVPRRHPMYNVWFGLVVSLLLSGQHVPCTVAHTSKSQSLLAVGMGDLRRHSR